MVLDPSAEFFQYFQSTEWRARDSSRARVAKLAGASLTECDVADSLWAAFALVLDRRRAAAARSRRGCGATRFGRLIELSRRPAALHRTRSSIALGLIVVLAVLAMRKWLLPEAIEDVLPDEAARVEALRRALLDHFASRGYRLVQPPLVEHLDSLLTGTGRDLELQTFKVVDPLSGRLLGVRADTTPQVARIDAHLLNEAGVTRLCYAGSVCARMPSGPGDTREVVQIGAELFGEPRHRGAIAKWSARAVLARGGRHRRAAPRSRPRRRLSRARRTARASQATARTATCFAALRGEGRRSSAS